MQSHTLTFASFISKRIAIDWIKENIEVDEENEALTELRYTFYTGHTINRMMKEVPYLSYVCHDF